MYVPTNVLLKKILEELVNGTLSGHGALSGLFLGLAQFPSNTLNPAQGLADITEADYNTYARQAVVWSAPYTDSSGQQAVQSTSLFWQPTDALKPNQITMLFLADAVSAGNLLLSEVLPGGPIFLNDPSNAFGVSIVFQLPVTANYGDAIIIH